MEVMHVQNTKLYQQIISDSEKFFPKIEHPFADTNLPADLELDEFQFYIHNVGYWLIQLGRQLNELEFSIDFLRNYDYKHFKKKIRPNRVDHLEYTISNFYIRFSSVLDKSLQLTNAVFHLGIGEKDVNETIILNNLFVRRSKVYNSFRKVKKVTEGDTSIRNSIIHRDLYNDKQLHKLRFYYSFDKTVEVDYLDINFGDYRKQKLREYVAEIEKNFKEKHSIINMELEALFEDLFEQYIEKRKMFITMGFGPIA